MNIAICRKCVVARYRNKSKDHTDVLVNDFILELDTKQQKYFIDVYNLLSLYTLLLSFVETEKGRDLTQPYDKIPIS